MRKYSSFYDITKVTFINLKEEINYYLDFYRPMDKAGSYGIQDWMGYVGIKSIEGFFNVMGLHKLYREIEKIISKRTNSHFIRIQSKSCNNSPATFSH